MREGCDSTILRPYGGTRSLTFIKVESFSAARVKPLSGLVDPRYTAGVGLRRYSANAAAGLGGPEAGSALQPG